MVWQPCYHSVCERNRILNYLSCCEPGAFFPALQKAECSPSIAELSNDVGPTDVIQDRMQLFVTGRAALHIAEIIPSLYPLDVITILSWEKE